VWGYCLWANELQTFWDFSFLLLGAGAALGYVRVGLIPGTNGALHAMLMFVRTLCFCRASFVALKRKTDVFPSW
jgi:hypothetical protein